MDRLGRIIRKRKKENRNLLLETKQHEAFLERCERSEEIITLTTGFTDEFIQGRMDFMNLIIATIRAVGQDDLPSWAVDRVND